MILVKLPSALDVLGPIIPFLTVVTLFGSVVVTAIALYYQDRPGVRKAFVVLFAFCLITMTLTDLQFLPFISWHKFANAHDTDMTRHQIRLVDDAGREVKYDREAPFANDGILHRSIAKQMATEYDDETNEEVAAYLLQQGQEYRVTVENGGRFLRPVRFPPHGLDIGWDRIDTTQYGEFVGLRVYEVHIATDEAGSELVLHEERVVYEYMPNADGVNASATSAVLDVPQQVDAPRQADAMARRVVA